MNSWRHKALRVTAASAAACALLINLLDLGFMLWVGITGSAEILGIDPRRILGDALVNLAGGVGFPILALVMIARSGEHYGVVMAALFLGVFPLWGGIMDSKIFDDEPWRPFAVMVGGALAHAIGIRFTQMFPRALTPPDFDYMRTNRLGRLIGTTLKPLLKLWIFWTFAIALEVGFRLIPIPGRLPWMIHLLVWLALGATFLYTSYVQGSKQERRRIFWIMEGVAVFLVVQVLDIGLWIIGRTGLVDIEIMLWANWLRVITAGLTAWIRRYSTTSPGGHLP